MILAPAVARSLLARGFDTVGLGVATVLVARSGGVEVLGWFALLRVVAELGGRLCAGRVLGALPFLLARSERRDGELRAALLWSAVVGATAGTCVWALVAPYAGPVLLEGLPRDALLLSSLLLATRLLRSTGEGWLRGRGDLVWADGVGGAEPIAFVASYGVLWVLSPLSAGPHLVLALLLADLLVGAVAWVRLLSCRALAGARRRPDVRAARVLVRRASRGHVGTLLGLLSSRLDLVLVALLADARELGLYVVARTAVGVLRLPGLATHLTGYPVLRREGARQSAAQVPHLVSRALTLGVGCAALLLAVVPLALPALLGEGFGEAVLVTSVLAVALVPDAAAALLLAWLYAAGQPRRAARGAAAGSVFSLGLGLALVPPLGPVGAALASAAGSAVTCRVLWRGYRAVAGSGGVRLLLRAPPGAEMHVA